MRFHVRAPRRPRPDRADLVGRARRHAVGATAVVLASASRCGADRVRGPRGGHAASPGARPAAAGAVGAAAVFVAIVFCRLGAFGRPGHAGAAGRSVGGCRARARPMAGLACICHGAIFAALFGVAGSWRRAVRLSAVIPVLWRAAAVFAPMALLVALYYRIAGLDRSIPFTTGGDPCRRPIGARPKQLAGARTRPGLAIRPRCLPPARSARWRWR